MKRVLSLLLLAAMLLTGCRRYNPQAFDAVFFYYTQAEYQYGIQDGVIAYEFREASGLREDTKRLLQVYLQGPSDDSLRNPFPKNVRILTVRKDPESALVRITDTTGKLTDLQFNIASTCMGYTVMDLLQIPEVTIASGTRSSTIRKDLTLLLDDRLPDLNQKQRKTTGGTR